MLWCKNSCFEAKKEQHKLMCVCVNFFGPTMEFLRCKQIQKLSPVLKGSLEMKEAEMTLVCEKLYMIVVFRFKCITLGKINFNPYSGATPAVK